MASDIERMDAIRSSAPPVIASYGWKSLHEQSHGESFLALVRNRFRGEGLYILDEPEAALSPNRQLALLSAMYDLVPILMAYPAATIYHLTAEGLQPIKYEKADHYQTTRDFLDNRERYFKHLFAAPTSD